MYHWSPALALGRQAYSHSKHVLQDFLRDKTNGMALACAKEDVRMCREHLLLTQDNASEKRKEHLKAIGELLASARNMAVKHIVNEIFKVKEAKELARRLNAKIPTDSNDPLASVLIPTQHDGGWTRGSITTEVETAILQQNQKDLEYDNQCPFLQPPKEYLGALGETKGSDAVLQGDIDVSGYSNPVKLEALMHHLKRITA